MEQVASNGDYEWDKKQPKHLCCELATDGRVSKIDRDSKQQEYRDQPDQIRNAMQHITFGRAPLHSDSLRLTTPHRIYEHVASTYRSAQKLSGRTHSSSSSAAHDHRILSGKIGGLTSSLLSQRAAQTSHDSGVSTNSRLSVVNVGSRKLRETERG